MALVSLILTSLASLAPVNAQDITSTICAKRSAVFYTSGSSTYVVSPWPSSAATSVSNPACSVTATLPPVTTTVYASSPTASQPGETVVNESFENGTSIPFQTSTSSSNVSAQVAQGGPVAPNSGANYFLVTYNVSSPNSDNRLQSAGPNVNVYNLTQSFNTTSGVSYTVSASSKQASNGAQQPDCTVQICADAACGPQTGLTPSYQPYSYTFVATSAGDTVAILSYSCTGPAYVGVDDVAFSKTNGASSSGAQTVISYITTTLVQTTTASGQSSSMAVCPSSQFALAPSVSTVTLPASTVTFTPAAVTTTVDFTTLELATATLTNTNTQTTTAMGPTATAAEICDTSPLKGRDFYDFSAWNVTTSSQGSLNINNTGGYSGSFALAVCDSPNQAADTQLLQQYVRTCPGVNYTFSYAYNLLGDVDNSTGDLSYLEGFQNNNYIISVQTGDPDSLGNSPGQTWYTSRGSFVANESLTNIIIAFTCTSFQQMTFGLDSFYVGATPS